MFLNDSNIYFSIADNYEPLSKVEQLALWLKIDKAMQLLKDFRIKYNKRYVVSDKNFINFNEKLINDFLAHKDVPSKNKYLIKAALKARDTLLFTNMRLIIKVAKKFSATSNIRVEKLVPAGIYGALKAIIKFKPDSESKKCKQLDLFATNDTPKVRQYKVSSYIQIWVTCMVRLEVKEILNETHFELDTTDNRAYNLAQQDTTESDSTLTELQTFILENDPLEIALNLDKSIEDCCKLKEDLILLLQSKN